MAEIVGSAIVEEAVSRVFSGIATATRKDEEEAAEDGLERLEMAQIKMEAALETSGKWQITDVSLLRWRNKLKRAAEDCNDAARKCRQLSQEEEDEKERLVRQSSFPRRMAHATKAFAYSFVGGGGDNNNDHCSAGGGGSNNKDHCSAGGSIAASAVRRFERLADSAGEFMRFVQLGGTPRRQHLFFDPLIGHIFAGKSMIYQVSRPRGRHNFIIWPMDTEERGLEAMLSFMYQDREVPNNSFCLLLMLRLSESTDIIGTAVKCLRLVAPHFNSIADVAIKEITQFPTQDFTCVTAEVVNNQMKHWNPGWWNYVHKSLTGWFRPDPLCCQGYEHQGRSVSSCGGSSANDSGNKLRLSSIFPEQVSQVFLQSHISLSEYNIFVPVSSSTTDVGYDIIDDMSASLENFPPLKLGILLLPHDSNLEEDPRSAGEAGYAIEAINEEKQEHLTHLNVHPSQLDEMFLPKAIDYLYHNVDGTTYQICWRSNHGSAHMCMEKTRIMMGARRSTRGRNINKVRRMEQEQQIRKAQWKQVARDFLKLWIVRSSERLQSSISAWLGDNKASG